MVDFVRDRLKQKKDLETIVHELLHDIISPDYTQTGKFCFLPIGSGRWLRQHDLHPGAAQVVSTYITPSFN